MRTQAQTHARTVVHSTLRALHGACALHGHGQGCGQGQDKNSASGGAHELRSSVETPNAGFTSCSACSKSARVTCIESDETCLMFSAETCRPIVKYKVKNRVKVEDRVQTCRSSAKEEADSTSPYSTVLYITTWSME